MNLPSSSRRSSGAVEEVIGLLRPGVELSQNGVKAGYVDLLGEQDAVGPHRGQQVFRSKLVPLVYEHVWRPTVARAFVGWRGPGFRKEMEMALDMLEIRPGDRVIDVGCGTGNYTRHFAEAAGDGVVVGIDASESMITAAARRGGGANLAYVRGDACSLPFEDGEFDAVCCIGVIHMLEEPMAALDEMVRILAPGGRLVVFASCTDSYPPPRAPKGVTVFGRDELTKALADRGVPDVSQRVINRAQLVAARKAAAQQ